MNMIPNPPAREGSLGFLYLPPYRIHGTSIAGESTCIGIPELDICFDMGICPRSMLAMKTIAITHGHMDHIGGLAYYLSQRYFQGMGEGTVVCDARIAPHIQRMMEGYIELERQTTPYKLIPLKAGEEHQIKNNIMLRAFEVEHTVPAFGYTIVEKRSKLKDEYNGLPQEKLKELRDRGTEITRIIEVPLIAYLGDTAPGPALLREDVRKAQIVISECTFTEPEHKDRAIVGMHMHAEAVAEWLRVLESQFLVLTHLSRRTNLQYARKRLQDLAGPTLSKKIEFLMDHKFNKERYEKQLADNGQLADYLAKNKRTGPRPGGPGGGAGRPGMGGGRPSGGRPPYNAGSRPGGGGSSSGGGYGARKP
jgi:ribonuclease Z